jgi:oligopeptide transport system substrate-binding protein
MRLRRAGSALLAAALVVLAAACSPSDDVRVPAAAPGARAGGVLRVASGEPASIDPGSVRDAPGRMIVDAMCDPLIAFDQLTGEPKPGLADSWTLSDRGKKLTIRVRRNAKFSNGRDVTANDVLFSLSRLASADFASPSSDLVQLILGYPTVHGDERTDSEELKRSLKGIKVIEGNSVEIELATEFAPFVRGLGHLATAIVSRDAAERDPVAFERMPVCAGPYQLAQPWRPGDKQILLDRVAGYGARNAAHTAGGRGYADRIEVHVLPTADAQLQAFTNGEVDVAEIPDARLTEARAQLGARVRTAATPTIEYVGVPATDPVFRDPNVRIALSLALDRRAIAERSFGGARAAATGFYPPTLGSTLYRDHACGASVGDGADLAKAAALLAAAGADLEGRKLRLSFNDELANRRLVEAVAAQWHAGLGLEVELAPMAWPEFLSTGTSGDGFRGAFRMSWQAAHPEPDRYIAPLFSADGIGVGNFARFTDPDIDRRLRFSARRTLDEEGSVLEYRRLEDLACEHMPMIPVTFDVDHLAVRTERVSAPEGRLTGLTDGTPSLRELYLLGSA